MSRKTPQITTATLAAWLLLACRDDTSDLSKRRDTTMTVTPTSTLPAGELAYVTNEDSQDLTVIATANDSVVATIPVGTRPRGVRVSTDGRFVYVALSGSPKCPPTMPDEECDKLIADKTKDGIAEIDVAARKVTRVLPGGSDPEQFDLSRDGTRLYVSNEDVGKASIVSLTSGRVDTTVAVGEEPEGVRVSPDGKLVYVTAETDHAIHVLDAATGHEQAVINVGRRPRDVAFSPDGTRAYATAEVDGTVSIIDVPKHRVIGTIRLRPEAKPMGVLASADGKRLYVATGRGGTVEVIDIPSQRVTHSVKVGARPWGIALAAGGRKLYTANGPSNDASVIDTETMQVIKTIPVGKIPWGVATGISPAAPTTLTQ